MWRYWEHTIRDDTDFAMHFNYIHFNPVKHGLVTRGHTIGEGQAFIVIKIRLLPGGLGSEQPFIFNECTFGE